MFVNLGKILKILFGEDLEFSLYTSDCADTLAVINL